LREFGESSRINQWERRTQQLTEELGVVNPFSEVLLELEDEEKHLVIEIDLHITGVSAARKCPKDTGITLCSTSPPDENVVAGISSSGLSTIRPWKHAKTGITS